MAVETLPRKSPVSRPASNGSGNKINYEIYGTIRSGIGQPFPLRNVFVHQLAFRLNRQFTYGFKARVSQGLGCEMISVLKSVPFVK